MGRPFPGSTRRSAALASSAPSRCDPGAAAAPVTARTEVQTESGSEELGDVTLRVAAENASSLAAVAR